VNSGPVIEALFNDGVIPFFDEHGASLPHTLTDLRGQSSAAPRPCMSTLYLVVGNIDHTRAKTNSQRQNGICGRFHETLLDHFYRVAFKRKIRHGVEEFQRDPDAFLAE
jgi:hypothetical protein